MPLDELLTGSAEETGSPEDSGSPEDRQRYTRRSTLVAAHLRIADELLEVDILDLSEGGAKLKVPAVLNRGTKVALLVEGVGEFGGRVAWRQGDAHGIEFRESPAAVAESIPQIMESADEARERRMHMRSSVLWRAEIFSGIRRADCDILNISAGGCRVRLATEFVASDEVTIRSVRFGERKGRVVWKTADRLGIQFNEVD